MTGPDGHRISLRDTTITDNGGDGVSVTADTKILRSTISRNGGNGVFVVFTEKRARVRDSSISDNAAGGVVMHQFGKILLKDSTLVRNGGRGAEGVAGGQAIRSVLSDNGADGYWGTLRRIKDSDFSRNGGDGAALGGKARNSTFQDNQVVGLWAAKSTVIGCSITGNGSHSDCGASLACGDVGGTVGSVAQGRVKLKNTICETSVDIFSCCPTVTLGLCALD